MTPELYVKPRLQDLIHGVFQNGCGSYGEVACVIIEFLLHHKQPASRLAPVETRRET